MKKEFFEKQPLKQADPLEDVVRTAVWLMSDYSKGVTGQIINVDGGMNSHAPTVAQFKQLNSRTW